MKSAQQFVGAVAVSIALVLSGSACGSDLPDPTGEALDLVAATAQGSDFERDYESLEELAALITSRHDTAQEFGEIVVGQITKVEAGSSFRWEIGDSGETRVVLPYGDPDAWLDTMHLTVEVSETIAPHSDSQRREISVGVSVRPGFDLDMFKADYLSLGEVVLFLESRSPVWDYEPGLYGIAEEGTLMGVLSDDVATFPLLEVSDPVRPANGIGLDALRLAAQTP